MVGVFFWTGFMFRQFVSIWNTNIVSQRNLPVSRSGDGERHWVRPIIGHSSNIGHSSFHSTILQRYPITCSMYLPNVSDKYVQQNKWNNDCSMHKNQRITDQRKLILTRQMLQVSEAKFLRDAGQRCNSSAHKNWLFRHQGFVKFILWNKSMRVPSPSLFYLDGQVTDVQQANIYCNYRLRGQ